MEEWNKSKTFRESSQYAWRGVLFSVTSESNVRRQVFISLIVLLLAVVLRIQLDHIIILILAGALVFVAELMNTALEYIEDVIHPEYHVALKHSKDISAGAVLVASIAAFVIGLLIFLPPLFHLVW